MDIKGRIHSIETFGTLDGPGIRYVVFFQGCPLRCKYCHNRDTWNTHGGKEYTVDELLSDTKKYMPFFKSSNGGITVSGGEPTLQSEFLKEFLKAAKKDKIHTALDTSGFVDITVIDPILDYTDLVLLDIKHIRDSEFKELTGVSNTKTLELAKHLDKRNIPTWIRYVLVPGITDKEEDLVELSKFINTLGNVQKVEILPYHIMGSYKWDELGIKNPLEGVEPATKEDVLKAANVFKQYGIDVKVKS